MATTVRFPSPNDDALHLGIVPQYDALVYTRRRWDDEWEILPNLYPLEVTWSVAPTLPVATLELDYGRIRQSYRHLDDAGNEVHGFGDVFKTAATGLVGSYIKIECHTLISENLPIELTRVWHGIIEEAHDEQGAVDQQTGLTTGHVTLVAYGLEKLLADHQVLGATCQGLAKVDVPLDFNRAGPRGVEGNRSPDPFLGSYLFATAPSTAKTWSSRNIVEYLLAHQSPQDEAGAGKLVWGVDVVDARYIPDEDTPLLKCESASVYSLLSQVIDRRRGIFWWVEVDDDILVIRVNSINENDIIGNKITIPGNSRQIDLQYDTDPLTNVAVNTSDLPRYHQVLCRGPRIRCVGTFSDQDGTLEPAWSTADETAYEAGGTPHPANTPVKRKQIRNDGVRRAPKLAKVYRVFRVPEDWDGQVGDGLGGDLAPLFVDQFGATLDHCYMALAFEQSMPIIEGVDYEGTRIRAGVVALDTINEREMRPLCFLRRPSKTDEPYKYQLAEGTATEVERSNARENERIQCHLGVPQETLTLQLDVQGQPQHAIAYSDFTPLAEDRAVGRFDWREAVFTASIESQTHTEARWPNPAHASDAVRVKLIHAGDQYYQHYVAPSTVIGIDEDGYLVTSDGGWIPTLGDPLNPLPYLEDLAQIAGVWYTEHHYVLRLESYRLKADSDVPLGGLIVQAGGGPVDPGHRMRVGAPITQIKFVYPRGDGSRTPPARMQLQTWAGELDAVELVAVKPPPPPRRSFSGELLPGSPK